MATTEEIEAAANGMYGDKWYDPDPLIRPDEKTKDIWRCLAKKALEGVDRYKREQAENSIQPYP
jgi:hypothetical protein